MTFALPETASLPTPSERHRERVVTAIALAEVAVLLLLLGATLFSSSLTLLSTLLRMAVLLAIQVTTISLLYGVHRQRFGRLSYGVGKLEQLSNLLGCTGLVIGGAWVGARIVDLLFLAPSAVTPTGLGLAAVASAIVTLVNALGLIAMNRALSAETSAIFRGQLRAREAKFYAAVAAQVAITIAALSRDPAVAATMDCLGALIIAVVMIGYGLRLGRGCILNLLDHDVTAPVAQRIEAALGRSTDGAPFGLRSRRSGRFVQVEVDLPPAHGETATEFAQRALRIERALREEIGADSDVSVVLGLERRP